MSLSWLIDRSLKVEPTTATQGLNAMFSLRSLAMWYLSIGNISVKQTFFAQAKRQVSNFFNLSTFIAVKNEVLSMTTAKFATSSSTFSFKLFSISGLILK
jgi:hypothetical protein